MASLRELKHARRMDAQFRTMDMDQIPIGKPIDERSMVAAASDPNVVSMQHLKRLHEQSKQHKKQQIQTTWSQLAGSLSRVSPVSTKSVRPIKEIAPKPVLRTDIPQRKHVLLQTYQDIANDLRNFKTLPYKTNLEKIGACFLGNNRAYLSITTFVAICIVLIIVLLLCIRRPRSY